MIRDATNNWSQPRASRGLYIVRSINNLGIIRVGAGGLNDGRGGIYARLNNHLRQWAGQPTCGTHECQPFEIIKAWELADWTAQELAAGEHCLYRSFGIRFTRRQGGLPDRSLFLVPADTDLTKVLDEVNCDLTLIEGLRRLRS